jgi:hypothetical protein
MFNDEEPEDFEEYSENDHINFQKIRIEREFFEAIDKNENISMYLYVPIQLLTDRVKAELDKYLIEQAYVNMFIFNRDADVYHDGFVQIGVQDNKHKLRILNQMLPYFTEKEEYEKCIKIKEKIDTLTQTQ